MSSATRFAGLFYMKIRKLNKVLRRVTTKAKMEERRRTWEETKKRLPGLGWLPNTDRLR